MPGENMIKIELPTPFAVGDVNVYVIKGEALTLVDAGIKTAEAWDVFTRRLKASGLVPDDIEQVVLTHHHPDHVGLLEWLPEDIPVYGHDYSRPWLELDPEFLLAYDRFYSRLFTEFGVAGNFERMLKMLKAPLRYAARRRLTHEVKEGDTIPGFEEWAVFETPGHAQSHLCFYREKDGLLIAGDHILAAISPNPLLEPPLVETDERPQPQLQMNRSLRKMLDLDIRRASTGHGEDVEEVRTWIERRLARQHERALQVRQLLGEKPMTTYELTKALFPAVYRKELGLTLSETTAQLDDLLDRGEIVKTKTAGGAAVFSSL